MEEIITTVNKVKYHQTEETYPFIQQAQRQQFGGIGTGPITTHVVDGTYQPPQQIDEPTKSFIHQCKMPSHADAKTNLERSIEEFAKAEKIDERTGTRDIHFGHFKAAIQHDLNLLLHYALAEILFISGYTPNRWKQVSDLMILKKEGITDVERL